MLAFVILGSIRLNVLPPNTDEAGYTLLALMPGGGSKLIGESKLFTMQLYSLLLSDAADPLWRARLLSIFTSTITLMCLGSFWMSPNRAYSPLTPAVLYALCPLAFFYTRIAMPEVFLVTTGCATLLVGNTLANRPSYKRAALLGCCLALALTVQMIALLFFLFPVLSILFFAADPWKKYAKALGVCYAIPLLVLIVLWAIGWGADVLRNGFVAQLSVEHPDGTSGQSLHLVVVNSGLIYRWLYSSMTMLLFGLGVSGALLAVVRRQRYGLFWVAVAAIYVVPFQLGARILLPQYMLFMAVPLTFLACDAIAAAAPLLSKALKHLTFVSVPAGISILIIATVVAMPLISRDYDVIFHPESARVSDDLHVGFVSGWPSGYCSRPIADYLRRLSKASQRDIHVLIFAVGDGAKRALTLELFRSATIRLSDIDLADPGARKQVQDWALTKPTYVVMDDPPFMPYRNLDYKPIMDSLVPVFLTEKPGGASATVVYRWQPINDNPANLLLALNHAQIIPETDGPTHASVEWTDEESPGTKTPVLMTLAPVEIAFPIHVTGENPAASFSLRLPADSHVPVEARIDVACGSSRKYVFRQLVADPDGRQWRSWKVPLAPDLSAACSLLVRALPAAGGGLGGGRRARLLWSNLALDNE
ncbi:MAG TPA: hypothetical protein VG672_08925 [Bryobacteraceae bacterium]|nr:hypothetical protein [Bryobacteraceae bacterium]